MSRFSVSIVCVATTDQEASLAALIYSKNAFPADSAIFVSDKTKLMDICTKNNIEFYRISPFYSVVEWGRYIVFELHSIIRTSHIILIHSDGFIINRNKWRPAFCDYDYIGAPWPTPKDPYSYRDINNKVCRVGNSVSIRSRALLELPSKLNLDWNTDLKKFHGHEDGFLCVHNRHLLEQSGCKFAPIELAASFSRETFTKYHIYHLIPFAFHRWNLSNLFFPRSNSNGTITYFFDIFKLFPIIDIFND